MGDGDYDTLGRRHNDHNDGVYSTDRYMADDDNNGGHEDGEVHRESTLDFFNETGLSNSPIENGMVDEFDERQMIAQNNDHLI